MKIAAINKICYTACVISICGSAIVGMAMVWSDSLDDTLWRVLMSFLILFLAAGGMLAVNNTFMRRAKD